METDEKIIVGNIARQRAFFATQQTKNIAFRLAQLRKLKQTVTRYQSKIEDALWTDLHKSPEEAFLTEISIVTSEINNHIAHLQSWAKSRKVPTPLHLQPSSSHIMYEPLGIVLIVAPWNYPFQLLFNPLIGAISAGCCSVLKPSASAPATAKVMEDIIAQCFEAHYVCLVQGAQETNSVLFAQGFDMLFFTGSPALGRVVMKAASETLTPVVLELGGKSPCIVDANADIDSAAKRIAWGKLINAGQTCIAPDYLLAHESIKDELLSKIALNIKQMYGDVIQQSRFYPRIVSKEALARLVGLLGQGTIHTGGQYDAEERFLAPTIIDHVESDFLIMQEEIFGPILPVMTFGHIDEAIAYINGNAKPLALYYFGRSKDASQVLARTTSGGACINDVLMHIVNHRLPFGGVGNSGMGSYHGQESFKAFSHKRAIVRSSTWIDVPFKYVPFKFFKQIKRWL